MPRKLHQRVSRGKQLLFELSVAVGAVARSSIYNSTGTEIMPALISEPSQFRRKVQRAEDLVELFMHLSY